MAYFQISHKPQDDFFKKVQKVNVECTSATDIFLIQSDLSWMAQLIHISQHEHHYAWVKYTNGALRHSVILADSYLQYML